MRHVAVAAVVTMLAANACGGSSGSGIPVSPTSAKVLTCSTQVFTADTEDEVTWSIDPEASGAIDAGGTYTAPLSTPPSSAVTVTATSATDTKTHGTASITLATAFPGAAKTIPGSTGGTAGVFPHAIAARGARVYSVWGAQPDASTPKLMLSRSDDGGATWAPAVVAIQVTLSDGVMSSFGSNATCAAVAIDAGDPDVVYVYGRIDHGNDLGDAVATGAAGGVTSFLSVSGDGGATFTTRVMQVGGTADGPLGGWDSPGICGDVASPVADTVIVESPGGYAGDGNPDIAIWADAARGAGFATGLSTPGDYVANGFTRALDNLKGNHDIEVRQNGGTNDAHNATESPRLFTDGAGRLCLTYYGVTVPELGQQQAHAYVQCSDDAAKTFSAPLVLDPSWPVGERISSPIGVFGPSRAAAVLWTTGVTDGKLMIATSSDGAATFGAPRAIPTPPLPAGGASFAANPSIAYDADGILWIAYVGTDGSIERLFVDKSCDGGQTWSGAVAVDMPVGGAPTNLQFPAFALTTGAAPHLVATAPDHLAYFTLAP